MAKRLAKRSQQIQNKIQKQQENQTHILQLVKCLYNQSEQIDRKEMKEYLAKLDLPSIGTIWIESLNTPVTKRRAC